MSIETEMTVLKRLGFFACLPDQQLRTIVFGAERLRLGAGRALYSEGDAADCAYIILGGRIDLFCTIQAGESAGRRSFRRVVYAAKAGEALGAFALISDKMRQTGAYVAQRGDVLRINRAAFRRQLRQHAEMRRELARYIFSNFQLMIAGMERGAEKFLGAA